LKIMAREMPETPEEMLRISHVTEANFKKYGHELLKITQEYAQVKLGKLNFISNKSFA
jgi:superfamily II DNA helicase RecQ